MPPGKNISPAGALLRPHTNGKATKEQRATQEPWRSGSRCSRTAPPGGSGRERRTGSSRRRRRPTSRHAPPARDRLMTASGLRPCTVYGPHPRTSPHTVPIRCRPAGVFQLLRQIAQLADDARLAVPALVKIAQDHDHLAVHLVDGLQHAYGGPLPAAARPPSPLKSAGPPAPCAAPAV